MSYARTFEDEEEAVACFLSQAGNLRLESAPSKIWRGISCAKYRLELGRGSYLLKLYAGADRTIRWRSEKAMLGSLPEVLPSLTPTILEEGELDIGRGYLFLLMNWIPGTPLAERLPHFGEREVNRCARQLASVLAAIHSMDIGPIEGLLKGPTGGMGLDDLIDRAVETHVLTHGQAKRFERYVGYSMPSSAVVTHGDFGFQNVHVGKDSDGNVCGLFDFEHSQIGHREDDFARLGVGGPADRAFVRALLSSYLEASGERASDFLAGVRRSTLISDLRVACQLASDGLLFLSGLAVTNHDAWLQCRRLYRSLGSTPSGPVLTMGTGWSELVARAERVEKGSVCRVRAVGAVVVDPEGRVLAEGRNELRPTRAVCWCGDETISIGLGDVRPRCPALHAEDNAIADALASGADLKGCALIVTCLPCLECAQMIVSSGIDQVLYRDSYWSDDGIDCLIASGVRIGRWQAECYVSDAVE